jgi:hypothetical protein
MRKTIFLLIFVLTACAPAVNTPVPSLTTVTSPAPSEATTPTPEDPNPWTTVPTWKGDVVIDGTGYTLETKQGTDGSVIGVTATGETFVWDEVEQTWTSAEAVVLRGTETKLTIEVLGLKGFTLSFFAHESLATELSGKNQIIGVGTVGDEVHYNYELDGKLVGGDVTTKLACVKALYNTWIYRGGQGSLSDFIDQWNAGEAQLTFQAKEYGKPNEARHDVTISPGDVIVRFFHPNSVIGKQYMTGVTFYDVNNVRMRVETVINDDKLELWIEVPVEGGKAVTGKALYAFENALYRLSNFYQATGSIRASANEINLYPTDSEIHRYLWKSYVTPEGYKAEYWAIYFVLP